MAYKNRQAKGLIDLGNHLFAKKRPLDSLNQDIAWQFAPDLADFTSPLDLGEDWGSDRMDGYPEQVSRELSNQLSAMLRPRDKPWFQSTTMDEALDAETPVARFRDYLTGRVRSGIYDARTNFVAAAKQTDRFYVNFGGGVLSCNEAPGDRDHLFFSNHHLRDCAWMENELGKIDHLHRKSSMTARQIVKRWPNGKIHESVRRASTKEPYREFEIRCITLPAEEYDDYASGDAGRRRAKRLPFVICYIDCENNCIIHDGGLPAFNYIVPRWVKFSTSQYAFSPASMPALADARMAQMLAQILLEAGEKAIEPPLIGKQEMVIGEPNLASGGITWIDVDHDMALKDAIEALDIRADLRVGFELRRDVREMLTKAFFIDKLQLPQAGDRATAYEISERIEQHVRNLLPLFEPMQVEYNVAILETAFAFLANMRKIDFSAMPEELSDLDMSWSFISPLQKAQDRMLVEQFMETLQLLAAGVEAGVTASPIHVDIALRDAVRGAGGPASWRKTIEEEQEEAELNQRRKMIQEAANTASQGAAIATQAGQAAESLQRGGILPPPPGAAPAAGASAGSAPALPAPSADQSGADPGDIPVDMDPDAIAQLIGDEPQEEEAMGNPIMEEILLMQQRILSTLSRLEGAINTPKQITLRRDSDGRISGATATPSGGNRLINQRASQ